MTEGFQPVKWEDMRIFQASVPDFCYEYEKTEEIAGYEVYHVGEGVYIFCELISLEECARLKMIETYPDLEFFAYGCQGKVLCGREWKLLRREGGDYKLLLFVVSKKYRRHDKDTFLHVLSRETERFDFRGKNQEIIEEFLKNLRRAEQTFFEDREEDFAYESLEQLLYMDGKNYLNRMNREKDNCDKITGKLGFRYEPDKYEKVNGWEPYFLCEGRIAKYVYPGIYHFEDSLGRSFGWGSEERTFPLFDGDFSLGDTWYCCLGVEAWAGATLQRCMGIRARYICLDRQSEPILRKMSEFLVDYKLGMKKQDVKKQDETAAPVLSLKEYCHAYEKKRNEEAAKYVIEDDAVELVEGYGFRDLTIQYNVIFRSEPLRPQDYYEKYDLAYVLGDCLILADLVAGRRLQVPLKAISTLRVKTVCDLGAGICENAVITVFDRRESLEREFLGEEAYEKYIRCLDHA